MLLSCHSHAHARESTPTSSPLTHAVVRPSHHASRRPQSAPESHTPAPFMCQVHAYEPQTCRCSEAPLRTPCPCAPWPTPHAYQRADSPHPVPRMPTRALRPGTPTPPALPAVPEVDPEEERVRAHEEALKKERDAHAACAAHLRELEELGPTPPTPQPLPMCAPAPHQLLSITPARPTDTPSPCMTCCQPPQHAPDLSTLPCLSRAPRPT